MNPITKRHIKLLAERFDHQIHYDRNTIHLSNFKNSIRIEETIKKELEVTYNVGNSEKLSHVVSFVELYDFLIKILIRYELEEVKLKLGTPIQLEDWIDTESYRSMRVIDLKRTILTKQSDHVILGGNRLELEYFKGVLILIDDLQWTPFNVIDFPLDD